MNKYCEQITNIAISIREHFRNRQIDPLDAIILDIDDTVITSTLTIGVKEPIVPIVELVHYFNYIGLNVFFITARVGMNIVKTITENELEELGIHYLRVFYRGGVFDDVAGYKRNIRKQLSSHYNIIMSIGDQPWDMGEYAGQGVLLPKPI